MLLDFELPFVTTRLSTAGGFDGFFDVGGNTCGLGADGELRCVGYARFVTSGMDRHVPWPVTVDPPPDEGGFRDVSGDYMHTCAVLRDGGRVVCWGYLQEGWLGTQLRCAGPSPFESCSDAQTVALYVRKESAGELTKATSVRVSVDLSCAVTSEREAYCWGENRFGLLGNGDLVAHSGAVKVQGVADIVEVAVGGGVACVRDEGGQVYCWGNKAAVGLGDDAVGDTSDGSYFHTPRAVLGLSDALNVWAGNAYVCARRRNGQVVCWGNNSGGQLGNGDRVSQTRPTPVQNLF
jgi:alpha-tubulin suppressor-like RCC1 family protein